MAKNHLQNSIAILLALFLSLLPGCGKGEKNLNIRMDLQQEVTSLDPQFSTSWESQVVMLNLFEGLLIRGGDGELSPGAASDYTVSSDGLTYTFHLRRDGVWDDGDPADGVEPTPVTAQDFVFSFWRIFDPEVPSPWAGDFQAIRNSQEVMAGELPKTQLGVWAIGEYTLVIQLSEPSPILLEQLAGPGALPCNETFFRDTRARYGQTMSLILGNGPFSLSDWNSEAVVLVPSSRYTGPQEVLSPSVVLYTGRAKRQETTDWQLFLDGKSDFCTAAGQVEGEQNFTLLPAQDTVWALVFREEEGSPLADVDIRRALALSIDGDSFGERVPEHFQRTDSLVPHSAALMGREYRSLASHPLPVGGGQGSFGGGAGAVGNHLPAEDHPPFAGIGGAGSPGGIPSKTMAAGTAAFYQPGNTAGRGVPAASGKGRIPDGDYRPCQRKQHPHGGP